jgi:FkbM family methyltransferase
MSILLFKSLWPEAAITGIEASPKTFALLEQNVGCLPGVKVVNRVVSDTHGMTSFFSGANSLISSTKALRGGYDETTVEATPLSEFITSPVDLLKIDIEGSESAVFGELETSGKLRMVREMVVEYHHNLPGERHRLSLFLGRLERCGFDYELAASLPPRSGHFQDVLIRAKRHN